MNKKIPLIFLAITFLTSCDLFGSKNNDEVKEDSYYLENPIVLNESNVIGERYYYKLPDIYKKVCLEFNYLSYGVNSVELLVRTLPQGKTLIDVKDESEFKGSSYGLGFYTLRLFDKNNNEVEMTGTTNDKYVNLYTARSLPRGNNTLKVLMQNTGISMGDAYLSITTVDNRTVELTGDETAIKNIEVNDEIIYVRNCDRPYNDSVYEFSFLYYKVIDQETGAQIEHFIPRSYYQLTLKENDEEIQLLESENGEQYYTNKVFDTHKSPKLTLIVKYLVDFGQDEVILRFVYRNATNY